MTTDYPTEAARTNDFRLGAPRDPSVAPDGRVLFLRSAAGDDPVHSLWLLDGDTETLVADGHGEPAGALSDAERARRERTRERAAGIVAYSTDAAHTRVVYPLDGALWTVELPRAGAAPRPVRLPAVGSVVDPRLDPTGRRVAYVSDGALRVVGVDGTGERALAVPESGDVSYGLAEHVAAESMDRARPLVVAGRRAAAGVPGGHRPGRPVVPGGSERPRPAADGTPVPVRRHRQRRGLALAVPGGRRREGAGRRHRRVRRRGHLAGRRPAGAAAEPRPARRAGAVGRSGHRRDHPGTRRPRRPLVGAGRRRARPARLRRAGVDGRRRRHPPAHRRRPARHPARPPGPLRVPGGRFRGGVPGRRRPPQVHAYRWTPDGLSRLTDGPGLHTVVAAGDTTAVTSLTMAHAGPRTTVRRAGTVREIRSVAHVPPIEPAVRWHTLGDRALRSAVLLPTGHRPGSGPLPVLLDPYGGPHGQVVVHARGHFHLSQWFADAGYAVLVTDGRGTPGRGPRWEKAVYRDKLSAALEDQVDALRAAAVEYPELDLTRVGIRGWSYGGYLAAAAVLRRPDVFHVAVAGAPVTDPRLYDTHWQERYLGHPDTEPEVYERNSLIPDAPNLTRPLMLVHGFADDNVYVAHTMRLSTALLAAGRDHTVLPLTASSHIAGETVVRANLPRLELAFLDRALRPSAPRTPTP